MTIPKLINHDRIEATLKMHRIAQIPALGQLIAVATIALNVAKVALDVFLLIATTPFCLAEKISDATIIKKIIVINWNARVGVSHHFTYIAIGIIRAVPFFGAFILAQQKIAPQRPHVWKHDKATNSVLAHKISPAIELSNKPLFPKILLIIPVISNLIYLIPLFDAVQKSIASFGETEKFYWNLTRVGIRICGVILPFSEILLQLAGLRDSTDDSPPLPTATCSHLSPHQQTIRPFTPSPVTLPSKTNDAWFVPEKHMTIEPKRIALVLGDSRIKNSVWEGGKVSPVLNYWKDVVGFDNKNAGLQTGMTEDDLQALNDDLESAATAEQLISQNDSKGLQTHISQRLETKKRCFIALKYLQRGGADGHVFGCVFEKDDKGIVRVYFLNLGEGSELFPIIKIDGKAKSPYRSQKRILGKTLFNGNAALDQAALQVLIDFAVIVPVNEPATSEKIMSFLERRSTLDIEDTMSEAYADTPQRSGTCTEKLAALSALDLLVGKKNLSDSQISEQLVKYKRYRLNGKLQAIKSLGVAATDHFHMLTEMLYAGAENVSKAYKKGHITQAELLLCVNLMEQTKALIDGNKKIKPIELNMAMAAGVEETKSYTFTVGEEVDIRTFLGKRVVSTGKSLRENLAALIPFAPKISQEQRICAQALNLIRRIPMPNTVENTNYWNGQTIEEKKQIVEALIGILRRAFEKLESKNNHKLMLFYWLCLVHIDHLTQQIPSYKRDRFALNIDVEYIKKGLICEFGDEQTLKDQIIDYFVKESNKGKIPLFESIKDFESSYKNAYNLYMSGFIKSGPWYSLFEYFYEDFVSACKKYNAPGYQVMAWLISDTYSDDTRKFDRDSGNTGNMGIKNFRTCALLWKDHNLFRNFNTEKDKLLRCRLNEKQQLSFKDWDFVNVQFDPKKDYIFSGTVANPTREMDSIVDLPETENSVLADSTPIATENKSSLTLEESHSLRKNNGYASSRVASLISWINLNPNRTGNLTVQALITKGLFIDRIYDDAVAEEPLIHEEMRRLVNEKIINIKFNQLEEVLYWIDIGFFAETHFAEANGKKLDETFLAQLNKQLDVAKRLVIDQAKDPLANSQKSNLLLMRIFEKKAMLCSYPLPLSSKNLSLSLAYNFIANWYRGKTDSMLDSESYFRMLTHIESGYEQTFIEATKLILNEMAPGLPKGEIIRCGIIYSLGDVAQINFEQGTIYIHQRAIRCPITVSGVNPNFITVLGHRFDTMRREGITFISEDGNFKVESDGLFMRDPDENSQWLKYVEANDSKSDTFLHCFHQRYLWISPNRPGETPERMVITDLDKNKVIWSENKGHILKRRLPKGQIVRSTRNLVEHPDAQAFLNHLGKDRIFWIDEKKGTLEAIELPKMNNMLIYREGDKYRCSAYPDYHLSPQQGVLNNSVVEGILNLTADNDPSESLVVIPYRKAFAFVPLSRSSIIHLHTIQDENNLYFTYRKDPLSGFYQSTDPVAMLYLAAITQHQGEHAKAITYLNRVPKIPKSQRTKVIMESIGEMGTRTPLGAPFALKVLYRYFIDGSTATNVKSEKLKLKFFATCFNSLWVYSHQKTHAYPEDLRLTDHELSVFIDLFRDKDSDVALEEHLELAVTTNRLLGNQVSYESIRQSQDNPQVDINWGGLSGVTVDPKLKAPFDISDTNVSMAEVLRHFEEGAFQRYFYSFFIQFLRVQENQTFTAAEIEKVTAAQVTGFTYADAILYELGKNRDAKIDAFYYARHFPQVFQDLVANPPTGNFLNQLFKRIKTLVSRLDELHKKKRILLKTKVTPTYEKPAKEVFPRLKIKLPKSDVISNEPILSELFTEGYTAASQKVVQTNAASFALKQIAQIQDPLAERMRVGICNAHQEMAAKDTYTKCTPKQVDRDAYKTNLETAKRTIVGEIEQLTGQIQALLLPNENSLNVKLAQLRSLQQSGITASCRDLLLAIASRNSSILFKKNAAVTQESLDVLTELGIKLMLLSSKNDQLKAAIGLLDKNDVIGAGEVLSKKRTYDPNVYPELLYYEYATGLQLRSEPDQAALVIGMFKVLFKTNQNDHDRAELRRICFEFQAGGGKTKVISVIMAAKAIAMGKMPIFYSLPQLCDISTQDLYEVLSSVFEHNIGFLEIGLNTTLDLKKLSEIYLCLRKKKESGTCMIFTPETYHAINLAWQEALESNDTALIGKINQIKKFFKEECVFLIDESHRNVDSLLVANKATGSPETIEEVEREFFMKAYRIMCGWELPHLNVDGQLLSKIFGIEANKQAQTEDGLKLKALHVLADVLIDQFPLQNEEKVILKAWVKDKDAKAPQLIEKLHNGDLKQQTIARLATLTRGLCLDILPHTLGMVGEMDYGKGSDPNDFVAVPRDQKNEIKAKFENADIAVALTIQDHMSMGITTVAAMCTVIQKLQALVKEESKSGAKETQTVLLFRKWQGTDKTPIELMSIDESWLKSETKVMAMIKRIGMHREVIEYHLRYNVLPQVLTFPTKLNSTGADLVTASWASVIFSATLGEKELYPIIEDSENYWMDTRFIANVIHRAGLPHNSTVSYPDAKQPADLFHDLTSAKLDEMEGLLDLGFWSKEATTETWAYEFMKYAKNNGLDKFDGALFFKKGSDGVKGLYLLEKNSETAHLLPSTNLFRLGLAGKKLFKIYGPDETTGTDLYLTPKAKMILTVGENTGICSAVQAIMRMRRFLYNPIDPENAQSLHWVVPSSLKSKVQEAASGTALPNLMSWMVQNEATRQRIAILARAEQEIHHIIRNEIDKRIAAVPNNKKGDVYKNHRQGYVFNTTRNTMFAYSMKKEEVSTVEALNKFTDGLAQRAKIALTPALRAQIDQVIAETSALVEKMVLGETKLNNTSKQATFQVQVSEQQEIAKAQAKQIKGGDQVCAVEKYSVKGASGDLVNLSIDVKPLHPAFMGSAFTVAPNCLKFVKNSGYIKPVDFFLLIEHNGTRRFIGVSSDDAKEYKAQLKEGHVRKNHRVALFASDGTIVMNGKKGTGISIPNATLKNEPWFSEELNALAFYNGHINNQEYIKKLAKNHPGELRTLWNTLKAAHIDGNDLFETNQLDEIYNLGKIEKIVLNNQMKVTILQKVMPAVKPNEVEKKPLPYYIGTVRVMGGFLYELMYSAIIKVFG